MITKNIHTNERRFKAQKRAGLTIYQAEQEYKKELAEGTINTCSTPHYNSLKDYCEMLKAMGIKIWED